MKAQKKNNNRVKLRYFDKKKEHAKEIGGMLNMHY